MRNYKFTIEGKPGSSLLMHADDVESGDILQAWRKNSANKAHKVAGDDRSPVWTYTHYFYARDGRVVIPTENLIACLVKGGMSIAPGKGRKQSIKAAVAAGLVFDAESFDLLVAGKPVKLDKVAALREKCMKAPFSEHQALAKSLGFSLDVRRAKVGQAKHVRVRPRFDKWAAVGTFSVIDDGALPHESIVDLWDISGATVGLMEWRPSAIKPGPYGKFDATIEEI